MQWKLCFAQRLNRPGGCYSFVYTYPDLKLACQVEHKGFPIALVFSENKKFLSVAFEGIDPDFVGAIGTFGPSSYIFNLDRCQEMVEFSQLGAYSIDTFLIADFGNKTYDILGSFSWRYEQKIIEGEGFYDTNGNGALDDGETFQDSNGDLRLTTYSDITALSAGTGFTTAYANKIKREFGYTQDPKLVSYVFDGQLSAGKFNTFTKSNIPKSTPFIAWTDNQIKPNLPSKPDTLLGSFDSSGKQVKSKNNNGGPYQPNLASGIRDFVNPDRKIVLKVTGNPDGNFKGCRGGSGGSGCSRPAHQESGKYKTYVKLYETRLPTSLPKTSSGTASNRLPANNAAESANSASEASIERTPEASPVLGLLGSCCLRPRHDRKSLSRRLAKTMAVREAFAVCPRSHPRRLVTHPNSYGLVGDVSSYGIFAGEKILQTIDSSRAILSAVGGNYDPESAHSRFTYSPSNYVRSHLSLASRHHRYSTPSASRLGVRWVRHCLSPCRTSG